MDFPGSLCEIVIQLVFTSATHAYRLLRHELENVVGPFQYLGNPTRGEFR